jgi:hypothetical protein
VESKSRSRVKFKPYFSPTPKRIRVLGDSLAAASIMVAGFNMDNPSVMIGCAIVGGVGKFLSNFFTIEKENEN